MRSRQYGEVFILPIDALSSFFSFIMKRNHVTHKLRQKQTLCFDLILLCDAIDSIGIEFSSARSITNQSFASAHYRLPAAHFMWEMCALLKIGEKWALCELRTHLRSLRFLISWQFAAEGRFVWSIEQQFNSVQNNIFTDRLRSNVELRAIRISFLRAHFDFLAHHCDQWLWLKVRQERQCLPI